MPCGRDHGIKGRLDLIPSVADSRSAKDGAQNAPGAIARIAPSIAPISVASVLTIALVIAPYEAVAESLR